MIPSIALDLRLPIEPGLRSLFQVHLDLAPSIAQARELSKWMLSSDWQLTSVNELNGLSYHYNAFRST